jgi:hypothetical protein
MTIIPRFGTKASFFFLAKVLHLSWFLAGLLDSQDIDSGFPPYFSWIMLGSFNPVRLWS